MIFPDKLAVLFLSYQKKNPTKIITSAYKPIRTFNLILTLISTIKSV